MDGLDTVNEGCSLDFNEPPQSCVTTSSPLKSSLFVQTKTSLSESHDEQLLQIITANLFKGNSSPQPIIFSPSPQSIHSLPTDLRLSYKTLKNKCVAAELTKGKLARKLKKTQSCSQCETLFEENRNTKQALDEAIELSTILLKEVYRMSE